MLIPPISLIPEAEEDAITEDMVMEELIDNPVIEAIVDEGWDMVVELDISISATLAQLNRSHKARNFWKQ